ncbi:hypothetical protein ACRQ5Q_22450 [Bradyrhizobium sp. PMVTL-01]|uniref:hypothetical protein n=1 Tax=Bradyrhizobium sp. PMVTL-01 TaxID=3434999 RepID=UPI003F72E925
MTMGAEERPWTRAEDIELKKARTAHVPWDVIVATFPTARTLLELKRRCEELPRTRKAKPQKKWSATETEKLLQLRDVERKPWPQIDAALGRGAGQAYSKYREIKQPAARVRVSTSDRRSPATDRVLEAIAKRDQRSMLTHASITAAVFGDPLPGQSALDKRIGIAP